MERISKVFETLKQVLEDESGYEFELRDVAEERTGVSYKQLLRKLDVESLPTILRLSLSSEGFFYFYGHYHELRRNIDWEKYWKDNNPISIDYVEAISISLL